ncbi:MULTISPECIES: ribonuclease J [Geobacter]|uniref:Ribonuclease J n=2 Tax=Geobacter TaxID=28231 RepID=A0A0C1QZ18_9BACT|nr:MULTISPECIES: ribonuclease J [Geobacter]ANA41283.1 ribonuclease J [Geobacter anodireducens]KIE43436.1 ribonuclease J [Geobacter soli]MBE2887833.1 ribonuclease J [Geobacter anodireducens]
MDTAPADITDNGGLRIIPLGGLGEIGLNMMAYEHGEDIIVADCGLMFPEPQMLGIDLVIPDIAYLRERAGRVRGILLTHGHEDHIGALPYVLQELSLPLYGTALTLGFIREKLKEFDLEGEVELNVVKPRDVVTLGCFSVEFIRVSHSIVDGCALAIRTPEGVVIHTGDFKIDQTPVDGELTDLATFSRYGDEGVLALLADSTNVEREGYTLSERVVGEAFDEIFPRCEGRIIVAAFSSNIHRVQQAVDAAVRCGRKVLLNGRSMVANVAIARQLGYLRMPEGVLTDLKELQHLPKEQVCMITTGSQGEPMSSLARIAMDDHKQIKLEAGDTVILSSRFIPGNEKTISDLINHLYRRGAEVFHEKVSEVHVSGHASQEELKLMLNLTRPRHFVPVHGEYRHLVKHARLAQRVGVPAERCLVAVNGDVIRFADGRGEIAGTVESGRVYIDGKGIGDVGEVVLKDRKHLSEDGMVVVIIAINQASGEVIYGPDIVSRGFVFEDESQQYLDETKKIVLDLLAGMNIETLGEWGEVKQEVRRILRRFFNKTIERRPVILPVILEM